MKFILDVTNKTPQKVSKKTLLSVFCNTLTLANLSCLQSKTLELSMAFVTLAEMEMLNRQYRRKKGPTDVLSFNEYRTRGELCAEKSEHIFLGELILCPDYISKNAKEDGETFEYADMYITSHGILHLLNFRHGQKMFGMQRQVANNLLQLEHNKK